MQTERERNCEIYGIVIASECRIRLTKRVIMIPECTCRLAIIVPVRLRFPSWPPFPKISGEEDLWGSIVLGVGVAAMEMDHDGHTIIVDGIGGIGILIAARKTISPMERPVDDIDLVGKVRHKVRANWEFVHPFDKHFFMLFNLEGFSRPG